MITDVLDFEGWDEGGAANLNTEDDLSAWTQSGTSPTVTAVDGPEPGVSGYNIADNDSSFEFVWRSAGFTGDGSKPFVVEFREGSSTPSNSRVFQIRDETDSLNMGAIDAVWSGGVPTLTPSGNLTVVALYPSGNGYWCAEGYVTGITAANDNRIRLIPAAVTAADTGDFDIGRVWWGDAVDESTVGGPHVRIQRKRRLLFSNTGFRTGTADEPPSWPMRPRVKQAVAVKRQMFGSGRTAGRSEIDLGEALLENADGYLDELDDYAFAGYRFTSWRSFSDDPTFPDDFEQVWSGRIREGLASLEEVRLELRDVQAELDEALQATTYTGGNTPPDGLEGESELKGKPKPLLFGKARNIEPVLVNAQKLIYQINVGSLSSVSGVRDDGSWVGLGYPEAEKAGGAEIDSSRSHRAWRIAYDGSGTWVVALFDGSLFYSTDDGESWTLGDASIFSGDTIASVKWLNGEQFVAVGENNKIATSPDGITWTARTSAMTSGEWIRDIDFGNGVYVAISYDESQYSTDGVTWTAGGVPGSPANIFKMAFGLGYFVAVAYDSATVYLTTDGTSWTTVATGASTTGFNGIHFNGERFVAAGDSAAIATSVNATKWAVVTPDDAYTSNLGQVGWGAGFGWLILPLGSASDTAWASQDGENFYHIDTGWATDLGLDSANDIEFGSGIWLAACGDNGNSENYAIKPKAYADYASQADLLDDTKAPAAGGVKTYLAGGYFRLGSAPFGRLTCDAIQGATAADRTASKVAEAILTEAGYSVPANLNTEDDLDSWAKSGTPVVSSASDPWGGTDAYAVADNDGAALEFVREDITFTGYGPRVFGWVCRENTHPATGNSLVKIQDVTAGASVGDIQITAWTDGEPTASLANGTGSKVHKIEIGNGYWLLWALTAPVTPANTHRLEIHPANATPSFETGTIDVYRVWAFDQATWPTDWDILASLRGDAATTAVVGAYFRDEVTVTAALDFVLGGSGFWWSQDRCACITWGRLESADSSESRLTINEGALVPLDRLQTPRPTWRTKVRWSRNYTPQDESSLAGNVIGRVAQDYARDWRESVSTDLAVQDIHPLAREQMVDSAIAESADADTESARLQALRGSTQRRYQATVDLDLAATKVDIGHTVTLQHATRLGLSSAKYAVVTGIDPNAADDTLRLEVLRL